MSLIANIVVGLVAWTYGAATAKRKILFIQVAPAAGGPARVLLS